MRLALAVGQAEAQGQSLDTHWVAEQAQQYPSLHIVHILGELSTLENVQDIAGFVVDAARPTEEMRKQIVAAHMLGKPVLAFVSTKCPNTEIVGDLADSQTEPYPLAEWLNYYGDNKRAITVSRGLLREIKLKVWLEAHLKLRPADSEEI